MFISTFHTLRFTSGATWKMMMLDQFIESLTHEQDKFIKMETIKGPMQMHLLCMKTATYSIQSPSRKEREMCVLSKRRNAIPNPLMIPLAPIVEMERKGSQSVVTAIAYIISNHRA